MNRGKPARTTSRPDLAFDPFADSLSPPDGHVIRNASEENDLDVMETYAMQTKSAPSYRPFPRRGDEDAPVPDFADMTPAERTLVMETLALFTGLDDGPARPPTTREELLRALPPGELPEGSVSPPDAP